ncbi:MAG: hypothetical protein KDA58_05215 [Planctomycetaceae bacterium]|nr:hypothetical protein [Planctomycetaceae bacterium]
MKRWLALQCDPIYLFLGLGICGLSWQTISWITAPTAGILAAGLLTLTMLVIPGRVQSPWKFFGLLAALGILGAFAASTDAVLTLCIAGVASLSLAGGLLLPPPAQTQSPTTVVAEPEHRTEFAPSLCETTDELIDWEEESSVGELLQQWERRRLNSGEELIETTLQVLFSAGCRMQTVHLPLHPPLPRIDQAHCEIVDGVAARCEVDAVRSYGVRVTLRRQGNCDDAATAYLWVSLCSTAATSRAA